MAKKNSLRTVGDRVRHLLERLWGGNQTEMAKAIGCSQSTLSQVANGKEPGKRLVTMIAAHNGVSQQWLLHGEGEPLLPEDGPFRLPIVKHPSIGVPKKATRDGSYEVPAEHRKQSCYWLEVGPKEPVVREEWEAVRSGDLLLIDTDQTSFPPIKRFFEKLCVVRISSRARLGSVSFVEESMDEGPSRIEVDTFDLAIPPGEIVMEYREGLFRGRKRTFVQCFRQAGETKTPITLFDLMEEPHRIEEKTFWGCVSF